MEIQTESPGIAPPLTAETKISAERAAATEASRKSRTALRRPVLYWAVSVITILIMYNDCIAGVERSVLLAHGAVFASYIPNGLGVLLVGVAFVLGFTGRRALSMVITAFCVAVLISYSLAMGRSIGAVAFSLYGILPVFLGYLVVIYRAERMIFRQMLAIWVVCVIGVILDHFLHFAWGGIGYEAFGRQVQTAIKWNSDNIPRLAGFSKASYVAANWIGISAALIIAEPIPTRTAQRNFQLMLRLVVWSAGLVVIYLTTSKTPLIVLAVTPLALFVFRAARMRDHGSGRLTIPLVRVTILVLVALIVLLPLANVSLSQGDVAGRGQGIFKLDSLVDRFTSQWPGAFNLLNQGQSPVQLLLGRGLGGIGGGQSIDEPALLNSADNLFIYLYVTVGIASAALVVALLRGIAPMYRQDPDLLERFYVATFFTLMMGLTTNVLESAPVCLVIGLMVGKAFRFRGPGPVLSSRQGPPHSRADRRSSPSRRDRIGATERAPQASNG